MRAHHLLFSSILIVLASACTDVEPRWTGSFSDSAGVTIVSNTDVGLWTPGEEWTLVEELRIGALEGSPEYVFGSVGGITVDSRGRIFVLDEHAQHIQVYSGDGSFLHTVGSRGEGPGEMQMAWAPFIGPGDTLVVPDGRLQRINLYSPDGLSVGSFRWNLDQGRTMAFKSTGSGLIAEQTRPMWDPLEAPADTKGLMDLIILRALDYTVTDTLMVFPSGEMMGAGGVRVFAPEPTWDIADDLQLAFGMNSEYRISLYKGGDLGRIIVKSSRRTPVSEMEKEAILGEMERRWAEASVSEEMAAQLRARWSFADFYPAYQDLVFGPRRTLWVQRVKMASELGEEELRDWQNARSPDWEVFDPEGRFLGVVTMPPRFRPLVFRGEKIYGVSWGDLDVEFVVRLGVMIPT